MSVFSVPITIGVNEEDIAREIEKNVEQQVVNKVYEELKEIIYKREYYMRKCDESNPEPLREMVKREVSRVIQDKEDVIIDAAAEKLADKMSRMKAVREKAAEIAEEVLG